MALALCVAASDGRVWNNILMIIGKTRRLWVAAGTTRVRPRVQGRGLSDDGCALRYVRSHTDPFVFLVLVQHVICGPLGWKGRPFAWPLLVFVVDRYEYLGSYDLLFFFAPRRCIGSCFISSEVCSWTWWDPPHLVSPSCIVVHLVSWHPSSPPFLVAPVRNGTPFSGGLSLLSPGSDPSPVEEAGAGSLWFSLLDPSHPPLGRSSTGMDELPTAMDAKSMATKLMERETTDVEVVQARPEHFGPMERLQEICYPTLGQGELMNRDHFERHWKTFPQGQHVAIDLRTGEVVGMNSGLFVHLDLDRPQHTFQDITDRLTFAGHDPHGDYYYGADISVHPDHRRRGLGTMLYDSRKRVAVEHNKKGVVAGGLLPGYARWRGRMNVQTYVDKVVRGELVDPTLSFQLRNGFQVRGLLHQYLEDSASDNWATLLYWENPDYEPSDDR